MRVQAEATQQLSSVQSDMRVSYGNDALMPPDSTPSVDSVAVEQDNLGFIHPESFNQANTDNHGTLNSHTHTDNIATVTTVPSPQQGLALKNTVTHRDSTAAYKVWTSANKSLALKLNQLDPSSGV